MKIDLGCGPNKREGFIGVDVMQFVRDGKETVDVVHDLGKEKWPWGDDTVEEAHCSHMIEHLTWTERVFFFNELARVCKKGAKTQVIFPHWCSMRYYGDPTHKDPISEFAFYYLLKSWRDQNAPHVGYTCDFDVTYGYNIRGDVVVRNQEYQQYAIANLKEVCQDVVGTLVKR
jgi:hypothetical protein